MRDDEAWIEWVARTALDGRMSVMLEHIESPFGTEVKIQTLHHAFTGEQIILYGHVAPSGYIFLHDNGAMVKALGEAKIQEKVKAFRLPNLWVHDGIVFHPVPVGIDRDTAFFSTILQLIAFMQHPSNPR